MRVRLLLDDIGTMPSAPLLAIDSHPNIEVRMFNPVALRSPRLLGMVADFGASINGCTTSLLPPTGKSPSSAAAISAMNI